MTKEAEISGKKVTQGRYSAFVPAPLLRSRAGRRLRHVKPASTRTEDKNSLGEPVAVHKTHPLLFYQFAFGNR